ncbi:MAG: ATP-binding protein [Chloroflexota bacterium]
MHSIRWRIALPFLLLIVGSIWGIGLYFSHYMAGAYVDNLRAHLTEQARLVAIAAGPYFSDEATAFDEFAKELGEEVDARITIIDPDGWVLGDSDSDPATMENHADRPEVSDALQGSVGTRTRYSTTLGYQMLYVAIPLESEGQAMGVIRLALPLSEVKAYTTHINYVVAIVAAIASAVAVALTLVIARVITAPVRNLTRMSADMAEGNFDQRVHVSSSDEIGELAHAFDRMASRIREMVTLISGERDKVVAVLANMADGALMTDRQGQVTLANAAAERMLRQTQQEMVGRSFIELARDYDLAELLGRCLESGEQQAGQAETGPDRRFLRMIATPIDGGSHSGALIILQDLTELRRLESVRRDFVSNVSHELRTPLASIRALAETLREGAVADLAVADGFLQRIELEVDRLGEMVEELNQLSRIESGEVTFDMRSVQVANVILQAVERVRPQLDRAELTLATDVPLSLPEALADQHQIENVLLNLLHNAVKFTPPGGRITLFARLEDDTIAISVRDTGTGIPSEDLPHIFERFYKADKARAKAGTGLGLAIAKHIVRGHGGQIWAESAEGEGSTFTFTLPVAR